MAQPVTVVAVVIEGGPGTVQKVYETVMGGTAGSLPSSTPCLRDMGTMTHETVTSGNRTGAM